MKAEKHLIFYMISFAIIFFVMLYFFDIVLNSVIAEWFTAKFLKYEMVDISLLDKKVMNHIFNWKLLKKYVIFSGFVSMCLITTVIYLLVKKSTKSARELERERIVQIIGMITEEKPLDHIPDRYLPIADKIRVLLKEQEKKNVEKDRVSDMIAYLAHDLRTPLTSIIGYLNLFLDAPQMPDNVRTDYLRKTLGKARKLDSLISDFFEITKYNSDKMSLHKQQINLHYMFVQLVDEFFPILETKKLKVQINTPEKLTVYADPEKMARAFSNLLKNACSYSFQNTVISITVKKETDTIEIFFANKGNPIPDYQKEQIFGHFVRLDEARSADSGGSGLGLAIAKAIISQHEGQITVFVQNEMNIFRITLPQKQEQTKKTGT